MGFFDYAERLRQNGPDYRLLHQHQCTLCPLKQQWSKLCTPQMPAAGSKRPLVYMLGEAPGEVEDSKGVPFVGPSGRVLRMRIPGHWEKRLRWNNCVRTRPPDNRDPTTEEIEACRPSIIRDIEASQPLAIFGFGNVALQWATGRTGITLWNGRRVPITVGRHTCWFYPMLHPAYVLRSRRYEPNSPRQYGSDLEFVFAKDLERAFAEVEALPKPVVHNEERARADIQIITGSGQHGIERVGDFLRNLLTEPVVGFDYETSSYRPYGQNAALLSVALAGKRGTMAIALSHPEAQWSTGELDTVHEFLRQFITLARGRKVVHNLVFELEWTGFFFGRKFVRAGRWGDSMSQAYILDERQGCLSLDFLCLQHFGLNLKSLSGIDSTRLAEMPLEVVLPYNGLDAKYHRLLYLAQARRLKAEGLQPVYRHHLRRIPTMALTQLKGVPVDQAQVAKLKRRYSKQLVAIEQEVVDTKAAHKFRAMVGHAFRPSSLTDVAKACKVLHLPYDGLTAKALMSVKHPLIKLVLRWRKVNKLLSTYVLPFELVHADGRLHPMISTTFTRTWRTSSRDPNIQNQPKRENKHMRAQVRDSKRQVVSFDYGQIQARNVAMESKDAALVKAFWDRYDIHADWMQRIGQAHPGWLPKDADLKKYRNRAKNEFVFPSFFGAQPRSLSNYLGIPESSAIGLHEEFWALFPDVRSWHQRVHADYMRHGYVTGLSGFRRRAPIGRNELINAPIQADESLIVCDAMARLSELGDPRFQASMEIHDDLTFFWPAAEIERNAEVVIAHMLNCPFDWINVPIVVEMSVGDDWASTKEVGVFASDTWNK